MWAGELGTAYCALQTRLQIDGTSSVLLGLHLHPACVGCGLVDIGWNGVTVRENVQTSIATHAY